MYSVYILRSRRNCKRYVGFTGKDVQERLKEHNSGSCRWTSRNGPFDLVYTDKFSTKEEAKEFEKFFKSGQGRQCLDEIGI